MRKLLLCLGALLLALGASAQSDEQPSVQSEETRPLPARYHKEPSRFIFGVTYRFSLGLVEHAAIKIDGMPKVSDNAMPENMKAGALLLNLGANITDNWALSAELGIAMYAGMEFWQLGAKVQYLYGKKSNRWFNYANVDGLIGFNGVSLLGGVGGGYRVKLGRRTFIDFTAGYEFLRQSASESYYRSDTQEYVSGRATYVRHGLVFGVGFVF